MTEATDYERDLRPFADPATDLAVTAGTDQLRVELIRNGDEHDYLIDLRTGRIKAHHSDDHPFLNLASLLASRDFADLRSMAETQARIDRDFQPRSLIPPEGWVDDAQLNSGTLEAAFSVRPTSNEGVNKLALLLLDGPAGVGKTSLIHVLVVDRARKYGREAIDPPVLHVTSRGRRLVSLTDALAQALQTLRAKFTFDQVPVLVRHRLLQVAIDGFDELVDSEGYKDAWFALRDFIEEVREGGPIILAGRDTFFDQQDFNERLKGLPHLVHVHHMRLEPVQPQTARDYLRAQHWSEEELGRPETDEILKHGSYALRPFFLTELAKVRGWSPFDINDITPRIFLINRFLEREADLVSQKITISPQILRQKLFELFGDIALEMADNETDAVDIPFLQLLTEVQFSDVLNKSDLGKLQHKAGSFALLEQDIRGDHRRFPHTEISNHFLSIALIGSINKAQYPRVLRRGLMGMDFLIVFEEVFHRITEKEATSFVTALEHLVQREITYDRLGQNVGSLLLATLSRKLNSKPRRIYQDLTVNEGVISGTAKAYLRGASVSRLDIREADVSNVAFEDCEIGTLIVDDLTWIGPKRPVTRALQVHAQDSVRTLYEPSRIDKWISDHSPALPGTHDRKTNEQALELFERVCRTMLRQYYIKDDANDPDGAYLQEPLWSKIEQILTKTNRVRRTSSKQASGPAASFIHLVDARSLLRRDGRDPMTDRIWEDVAAL